MNLKKHYLGVVLILIFFGSFLHYLKADSPMPSPKGKLSSLFPETQEYSGEVYSLGGSLVTPFTHTMKVDQTTGEILIATIGADFEYHGRLNPYLQIKESSFIFKNKNLVQYLGHDKRVTSYDSEKRILIVKYYLNNREKRTKEFGEFGPVFGVDSDTLPAYLQGMLLSCNNGELNLNLIQKAKGLSINVNFKSVTVENPLSISTDYVYPEGFRNSLPEIKNVNVYVMELTGLPALVYPYKYYFVYRKEPPFQLVAYWGGEPKEAEFAFMKE